MVIKANSSEATGIPKFDEMLQDEVYQARLETLRTAKDDGLQSGDAIPLEMSDILNEAKQHFNTKSIKYLIYSVGIVTHLDKADV